MKIMIKVLFGIFSLSLLLVPNYAISAQNMGENLAFLDKVKEVDWYKIVDSKNIVLGWKGIPDSFYGWNHKTAMRASKLSFYEVNVWSVRFTNKNWRPGEGGQICSTMAKQGRIKKTNCRK